MIVRKPALFIAIVVSALGLATGEAQNARSYDTSDWIPIPVPKAKEARKREATGRVLNLPDAPRNGFFPPAEEYRSQKPNVEVNQAQLQQYYVQQPSPQQYDVSAAFLRAHNNLLKQNYPNLPIGQQFLLQQPQPQYLLPPPQQQQQRNASYNPLGIGVQTINQELLGDTADGYKQIDITSTTPKTAAEKQNVQLLYVPLEQLREKQQHPAATNTGANYGSTPNQHKQHQLLRNIEKDFVHQALEAHKLQQQFQAYPSYALPQYTLPQYTSSLPPPTTLKPVSRKRRPHQPPLAVYMGGHKDAEVFDVLNVLKNARSIEVQDTVGPDSPEIFVGPGNLDPPDGYAKFDLPYLSSLDSNRVERKVDQLPFFVAPLNYKTPPGYSKIPLPSPHVGSVVVSHQKQAEEEPEIIFDDGVRATVTTTTTPQPPVRTRGRHRVKQPATNLQSAYADIHDVPETPSTRQPAYSVADQSTFSSAPQIRQKQQTSPHAYLPNYDFASNAPPKTKAIQNFYDELDGISTASPASHVRQQTYENPYAQPQGADLFSIIPPPPPVNPQKHGEFDFPTQYEAFSPRNVYDDYRQTPPKPANDYHQPLYRPQPEKTPSDYHLYQAAFQNPSLNQIENLANVPNQATIGTTSRGLAKPTEQATPITTRGQSDDKYTVLEEFSINPKPKTTTPEYSTSPIPQDEPTPSRNSLRQSQNYYVEQQLSPILPGLVNELQDQSVRQLLAPVLLAPTSTEKIKLPPPATEKQLDYYTTLDYDYVYPLPTTAEVPTTETAVLTTTTERKQQRTRSRGGSRFNLRASTTPGPRRNPQRARTQHPSRARSRQEASTAYTSAPLVTTEAAAPRRSHTTRQRFKTRVRPVKNKDDSASELISTYTPPEITTVPPQSDSYYETERPAHQFVAKSKTLPDPHYDPERHAHQFVAKSKTLSPEEEYLIKKYNLAYSVAGDASDNNNNGNGQAFSVNIQPTQATTEVPTTVYLTTVNPSDFRTTEYAYARTRGRFRGKTATTTSTTTTQPPPPPQTEAVKDEEFYGFFRQPTFSSTEDQRQTYREPVYSPSYVSSTVQPPVANHVEVVDADSVQFVGEIRPKFHAHVDVQPITTTARYYVRTTTTIAPKKRVRGRIRVPPKRISNAPPSSPASQNELEIVAEEATTQRVRGRGRSHFKIPDRLKPAGEDDDVDGGNYPRPFATRPDPTEKPPQQSFQISIDPSYEDERDDDQVPFSSIYQPKILPLGWSHRANDLPDDTKIDGEPITTSVSTTTEKKRGYWKLVKQKPVVDVLETAESQNVGVVSANSLLDIEEEEVTTEDSAKTTTPDFLEEIYEMFGLAPSMNGTELTTTTTTTSPVQFSPEDVSEVTSTESFDDSTATARVKTSTSTEVRLETEICYKGVCVKSEDRQ